MNQQRLFFLKILSFFCVVFGLYILLKPFINLQTIQSYHLPLNIWISNHSFLSSILFIFFFVIITSIGLPFIAIATMSAGFLFGGTWGLSLVLIAFFFHCLLSIIIVRYLFQDHVRQLFGSRLKKINNEIDKKGLFYIIFLRLSLITPSFVVNCAAALTNIHIIPFTLISVICSIPILSILVFSGELFGTITSIKDLYSTQNLIILISLALGSFTLLIIQRRK